MSPLLSIASADSTTLNFSASSSNYSPETFTLSEDSTISDILYTIPNYCSEEEDWACALFIIDTSINASFCSVQVDMGDELVDECTDEILEAWTYKLCWNQTCSVLNYDFFPFSSVSLTFDSSSSSWGGDTPVDPDPDDPEIWWSDSDSVFPWLNVPSSFTSWITELVENFWGTIANWLPVVILVALWITAIFALFRVVRWYARSSFRW